MRRSPSRASRSRDLDRIHGPAGLDLGGRSPAQIALAIAAEIVAVTSGGRSQGKAAVAAA